MQRGVLAFDRRGPWRGPEDTATLPAGNGPELERAAAEALKNHRDDETLRPTAHPSILRARLGAPASGVLHDVDGLINLALARAEDQVLRERIAEIVPEYIALGTTHVVARPELTLVA